VLLEGKQQSGQSTGSVRTGSLSIATNAAECSLRAHLEKMIESGRFQVELASERHDVEVSLSPLFDPSGARVRADT
jgi:glycine cleavage system aminomethyltransferase T